MIDAINCSRNTGTKIKSNWRKEHRVALRQKKHDDLKKKTKCFALFIFLHSHCSVGDLQNKKKNPWQPNLLINLLIHPLVTALMGCVSCSLPKLLSSEWWFYLLGCCCSKPASACFTSTHFFSIEGDVSCAPSKQCNKISSTPAAHTSPTNVNLTSAGDRPVQAKKVKVSCNSYKSFAREGKWSTVRLNYDLSVVTSAGSH